jgi:hypothetical protein
MLSWSGGGWTFDPVMRQNLPGALPPGVLGDEHKGLAVANLAPADIAVWPTTSANLFTLHKEQPAIKVSFHAAIAATRINGPGIAVCPDWPDRASVCPALRGFDRRPDLHAALRWSCCL